MLNENNQEETNIQESTAALAKHCTNSECFLYMRPQPNRTWCVECDTELVY